jgi:hypothetical protein
MPTNIPDGYWTMGPTNTFSSHETTSSTSDYLASIDRLLEQLAARGVAVDSGSRLLRYREQIGELDRGLAANDGRFRFGTGLNALFETRTLVVALTTLIDQLSDPVLKRTLKGQVSMVTESDATARNWQFQLFATALFKRAGATVTVAEPDCVVQWPGCRLGLAAKRLTSSTQVVRRLKEAEDQLRRAELDGVAVIDVSRIVNPSHKFLAPPDEVRAAELVGKVLDRSIPAINAGLRLSANSRMLAYVLVASLPTAWNKSQMGTTTQFNVVRVCDRTDSRALFVDEFVGRLQHALAAIP